MVAASHPLPCRPGGHFQPKKECPLSPFGDLAVPSPPFCRVKTVPEIPLTKPQHLHVSRNPQKRVTQTVVVHCFTREAQAAERLVNELVQESSQVLSDGFHAPTPVSVLRGTDLIIMAMGQNLAPAVNIPIPTKY